MSYKVCFYNTEDCTSNLTKEHIISKNVLKKSFGDKIKNITTLPNRKTLIDFEHMIKDVCSECNNNKLTKYDISGGEFTNYLINNTNKKDIPFSNEILCWLLKTHLNSLRTIKDKETGQYYDISQKIKDYIIYPNKNDKALKYFKFYVELWEDNGKNWNEDSSEKIQFFSYTSVRFFKQDIILSELRIRQLSTIILLPYKLNLRNFNTRCNSVIEEINKEFNYSFDEIDIKKAINKKTINIRSFLSQIIIDKIKRK